MPPQNSPPPTPSPAMSPEPAPVLDTSAKSLEDVDHDERLITIIRHHFFGIFIIYVQTVVALSVGIGLIYFLLPNFVDRSQTDVYRVVGLIAGAVVILMALILVIATIIYYSSRLILTDKNITQVLQIGIFHRKVSQLAVTNIEDVTATKQGIFSTLLNYGILNIETAGEQINFVFNYCPSPDFYARQILEAREQAGPRRR